MKEKKNKMIVLIVIIVIAIIILLYITSIIIKSMKKSNESLLVGQLRNEQKTSQNEANTIKTNTTENLSNVNITNETYNNTISNNEIDDIQISNNIYEQKYYNSQNSDIQDFVNMEEYAELKEIISYYVGYCQSVLNDFDKNINSASLLEILDKTYINENSITKDNVGNFIYGINTSSTAFLPLKIKVKSNDKKDVDKFLVYGLTYNIKNYNNVNEIYLMVSIDIVNSTYSVTPIKDGSQSLFNYDIKNNGTEIEQNNTNERFSETNYVTDNLADIFFADVQHLMLIKPDIAYNLLNTDYRNNNFSNYDDFYDFVQKNTNNIQNMLIDSYDLDNTIDGGGVILTYSTPQFSEKLVITIPSNYKNTFEYNFNFSN